MSRRRLAVLALGGVVLGLVVAALAPGAAGSLAGIALATALLTVPGLLLVRAVAPAGSLDGAELAAAGVGTGLAVAVAAALLAGLLPQEAQGPAFAIYVVAVAVLGIALLRPDLPALAARRPRPRWNLEVAMLGFAVLVTAGAIGAARSSAEAQDRAETFTGFWAVRMEDDPATIRMGIRSGEASRNTYRVEVAGDEGVLLRMEDVVLDPGGSWEIAVPDPARGTADLRLRLYRRGDGDPYRSLVLRAREAG